MMSGEVCWMFAVCCGEFEPPKDPETEQRCKVAPGNEGIERPVPLPRPKPEPTTPKLADLAEKGTFANLKFLKLSDEQVGDVAQELADDATIETLQLDGNFLDMFSPGACRALSLALSSNRTLLNLSLNQCIIGPEGAALIADGLATNTALRELRLDCVLACLPFLCQPQPLSLSHTSPSRPLLLHCADSRIGDPGVTALSSALEKNCELRVLSLKFNLISSASVPCLATALSSNLRSQLCTLDLDGTGTTYAHVRMPTRMQLPRTAPHSTPHPIPRAGWRGRQPGD